MPNAQLLLPVGQILGLLSPLHDEPDLSNIYDISDETFVKDALNGNAILDRSNDLTQQLFALNNST